MDYPEGPQWCMDYSRLTTIWKLEKINLMMLEPEQKMQSTDKLHYTYNYYIHVQCKIY